MGRSHFDSLLYFLKPRGHFVAEGGGSQIKYGTEFVEYFTGKLMSFMLDYIVIFKIDSPSDLTKI